MSASLLGVKKKNLLQWQHSHIRNKKASEQRLTVQQLSWILNPHLTFSRASYDFPQLRIFTEVRILLKVVGSIVWRQATKICRFNCSPLALFPPQPSVLKEPPHFPFMYFFCQFVFYSACYTLFLLARLFRWLRLPLFFVLCVKCFKIKTESCLISKSYNADCKIRFSRWCLWRVTRISPWLSHLMCTLFPVLSIKHSCLWLLTMTSIKACLWGYESCVT